jgi:RNA polymerase sigma-70 factor (ECF subfamily)
MPGLTLNTVQLHGLIDRMRAGDVAARDELLRAYYARLAELARQSLRTFPRLRRQEDTGDVLHPALLRLLRALDEVRPESTRAFLGLAALQIRRELLNLVRSHRDAAGPDTRCECCAAAKAETPAPPDVPDPEADPRDMDKWTAFHEGVERLPGEECEVVSLVYYHGLGHDEAAEILGVSRRTVKRRWEAAMMRLHQFLADAAS